MTLRDKKNESREHPDLSEYTELVNKTMMVQNQIQLLIPNPIFSPRIPKLQVMWFAGVEKMAFLPWLWRNTLSEAPALSGVLCSPPNFSSKVWFESIVPVAWGMGARLNR